jgi:hypothetical protein
MPARCEWVNTPSAYGFSTDLLPCHPLQDLAVYNLSRPGDAACRDAHLARAECDADEIRS